MLSAFLGDEHGSDPHYDRAYENMRHHLDAGGNANEVGCELLGVLPKWHRLCKTY